MKLTDAMSHLRSISDQTHKFWAYYQAVTAGVIGFAWASSKPPPELLIGLTVAYAIFAFLNCRLVVSSQEVALAVWRAIQKYKEQPSEPITPQFLPILDLNQPDDPTLIKGMHIGLSILTATAVLARIWLQPAC
ncbi:hypothetical protein [Pseudaquabacterium pictum]|uniref:Uncharacterized protein n=1 Tax=Pseudaquabacterium pictum TaxID=2315236 RepID=A0A480AQF1_9BURK|nr:hypothetical protein [Rubrivivax pictus]GCL62567.1 hypothetical protein AQPW35_16480 [Rubrivivax pictus]